MSNLDGEVVEGQAAVAELRDDLGRNLQRFDWRCWFVFLLLLLLLIVVVC